MFARVSAIGGSAIVELGYQALVEEVDSDDWGREVVAAVKIGVGSGQGWLAIIFPYNSDLP